MPKRAAIIETVKGNQSIPGITGPDFNEAVSAGRVLILRVEPRVKVEISFLNEGLNETAVMIHRKADPDLGTWENVARRGNLGGKNYAPPTVFEKRPTEEIYVISGWHKHGGAGSSDGWHQSAYLLNDERELALASNGIQYTRGFEDGGGGNDFNEPEMTITCQY